MGEINVVPYIDVMLVLLIIFMVTAPLLTQGVQVELPDVEAAPFDSAEFLDKEPLVLSVDRDGRFYLNLGGSEEAPLEDAEAERRARAALERDPKLAVLVKADTMVPYGRVVTGMAMLQRSGASRIGFLTDPAAVRALDAITAR